MSQEKIDLILQIVKKIQNTYRSLPHELAHAFDFYNRTELGYTPQNFITINLERHDVNSRFYPLVSCSKEFDEAFKRLYFNEQKRCAKRKGIWFNF